MRRTSNFLYRHPFVPSVSTVRCSPSVLTNPHPIVISLRCLLHTNAISILKQDHRDIERLFDELKQKIDPSKMANADLAKRRKASQLAKEGERRYKYDEEGRPHYEDEDEHTQGTDDRYPPSVKQQELYFGEAYDEEDSPEISEEDAQRMRDQEKQKKKNEKNQPDMRKHEHVQKRKDTAAGAPFRSTQATGLPYNHGITPTPIEKKKMESIKKKAEKSTRHVPSLSISTEPIGIEHPTQSEAQQDEYISKQKKQKGASKASKKSTDPISPHPFSKTEPPPFEPGEPAIQMSAIDYPAGAPEFTKESKRKVCQEILKDVLKFITVHTLIEEQHFYPVVRDVLTDGPSIADNSLQEHKEIKKKIKDLEYIAYNTPEDEWDETVVMDIQELEKITKHHMEEEENQIFPQLTKKMNKKDLESLGKKLRSAKQGAPVSSTTTRKKGKREPIARDEGYAENVLH